MRTHTYITSEGSFTIPQDWKKLFGEDVLNKKITVSSRLKALSIDRPAFYKLMSQDEEFVSWFDLKEQRRIGASNKNQAEITEKIQKTNLSKYGSKCPLSSKQVKEKAINTLKKNFGCEVPLQSEEIKEKVRQTNFVRYGKSRIYRKTWDEIEQWLMSYGIQPLERFDDCSCFVEHNARCIYCGKEFKFHFISNSSAFTQCPFCSKSSTVLERAIASFLSENFTVVPHYRPEWLDRKELDIYVPELNLAFEINGAFSHNSDIAYLGKAPKPHDYHQQKSQACLDHNIQLIHLWEHWDIDKTMDIVRARVGKSQRISARSLQIVYIDSSKARDFYEKNHIHGFVPSTFTLALCFENTIYQAMSFVSRQDNNWELTRLAVKQGFIVIGGSKRLFSHAIQILKSKHAESVVSFAYRDLTPDPLKSVYFRLGFSFEGFTQPGLFYYLRHSVKTPNGQTVKEGVYSRLKFQAHKAKEMGFTSSSFAELSSYGICRVFDSGNLKFKYNLKNHVNND